MEIKEINSSQIPKEILNFSPLECMNCGFNGVIPRRFFSVKPSIKNENEYNGFCLLLKEKFGFESFTQTGYGDAELIIVRRCPKCNSDDIFEDF